MTSPIQTTAHPSPSLSMSVGAVSVDASAHTKKNDRLTTKQVEVLKFLYRFHYEQDQLPPAHFIADHFGWKSANAAVEQLAALERKGYIEKNILGCKYRFTRQKVFA